MSIENQSAPVDGETLPVDAQAIPDAEPLGEAQEPAPEPQGEPEVEFSNDPNIQARMRAWEWRDKDAVGEVAEGGKPEPEPEPEPEPQPEPEPAPQVQPAPVEARTAPVEQPTQAETHQPPEMPQLRSLKEIREDMEQARYEGDEAKVEQLLREEQDVNYAEFKNREFWEQENQRYQSVANKAIAAHPELGEAGSAANVGVLAMKDALKAKGYTDSVALQMAVDRLYPDRPKPQDEPQRNTGPAQTRAPVVPDQTSRQDRKRATVVHIPRASARQVPGALPEQKPQTREDAIAAMKRARGQL